MILLPHPKSTAAVKVLNKNKTSKKAGFQSVKEYFPSMLFFRQNHILISNQIKDNEVFEDYVQ